MSLSPIDFNRIIEEHGEEVIWKKITKHYDPDYGNEITRTSKEEIIKGYLEEVSIWERQMTPGISTTIEIRASFRLGDISKGDVIVRYPETDDEVEYEVERIKKNPVYMEVDLKRKD